MPKPVFTLAFARAAFDAMVFDDGIAHTTKTHERRVFYAGAQSLLDILTTGLDQEHEGDADRMEAPSVELRKFGIAILLQISSSPKNALRNETTSSRRLPPQTPVAWRPVIPGVIAAISPGRAKVSLYAKRRMTDLYTACGRRPLAIAQLHKSMIMPAAYGE